MNVASTHRKPKKQVLSISPPMGKFGQPRLSLVYRPTRSHYGVTGSKRWSWVRLSLFDELQSRATSGGNRS